MIYGGKIITASDLIGVLDVRTAERIWVTCVARPSYC